MYDLDLPVLSTRLRALIAKFDRDSTWQARHISPLLSCKTSSKMRQLYMQKLRITFCAIALLVACLASTNRAFAQDAEATGISPSDVIAPIDESTLPSRIAFGSCGHQDKPQPVLRSVVEYQPDLFIYLGDNIYGDTKDMAVLKAKYDKLQAKEEFQSLRRSVPTLSVWDDHDYGWNDAGKEYPFKAESKEIFMDFWRVPGDSPRRKHPGIYGSHMFSGAGKRFQVILLDTRTFRDSLLRNRGLPQEPKYKNDYRPDPSETKTILGDVQWNWLSRELQRPADLRVICTSIQFGHEYNGWESWTNLPEQQQKMVETIKSSKANGVVFISGDVHWGEVSKREFEDCYPLFDVTASGITQDWHNTEPNKFRVGAVFPKNHFGMLQIDWTEANPSVTMQIIDVEGKIQVQHSVPLSELQFK